MTQMTPGQLVVLVGCVTLLCVAVIFSRSKREVRHQAILNPRSRVSISSETRLSMLFSGTRWGTARRRPQE